MERPRNMIESLHIAPATLRDLRPALHLERVCFGVDAWPVLDVIGALVWPGGVRLKAEIDRRMIGMVIADSDGRDGISMITTIGVDPDFRRQGVGTRLLTECESLLPRGTIRLTVRGDNQIAIHLYERFGYSFFSKVLNYYRDGQAGIVMEKIRAEESKPES